MSYHLAAEIYVAFVLLIVAVALFSAMSESAVADDQLAAEPDRRVSGNLPTKVTAHSSGLTANVVKIERERCKLINPLIEGRHHCVNPPDKNKASLKAVKTKAIDFTIEGFAEGFALMGIGLYPTKEGVEVARSILLRRSLTCRRSKHGKTGRGCDGICSSTGGDV